VMTRDSGRAAHDPGIAPPAIPDAAQVVAAPADAAIAVAATPDAAQAPVPVDAAVADAPPVPVDAAVPDAPGKRPHRPHSTGTPHAGSASGTPPGCDRSIDTDCDGIPDVR
jgi:hypothetical protein